MEKKTIDYPEIFTGRLWEIEGEVYELYDMRVTQVESPIDFLTTAFFRSKDPKSENPQFEEKIITILAQPEIYKRHFPRESNVDSSKEEINRELFVTKLMKILDNMNTSENVKALLYGQLLEKDKGSLSHTEIEIMYQLLKGSKSN